MSFRDFGRRGLREDVARHLAAVIELLVGTTRPHGRALAATIDESLDPRLASRATPHDVEVTSWPRAATIPRGLDSMVSLGRYDDGLGSLVATAKYEAWPLPLELLGRRLGVEVAARIDRSMPDALSGRRPVIVPVPTCGWRRWHRGIDHTHVLAQGVARELGAPVRRVLGCRWAPAQIELHGVDRHRSGSRFHARWFAGRFLRSPADVVLVDDVCTTGATLSGVASLLRAHGVLEVHAAVVARGADRPVERGSAGDRGG